MTPLNLNGDGMCLACINGDHRKPGPNPMWAVAHNSKQRELCNCPCHLPKSQQAGGRKKPKTEPAVQTSIEAPTLFIGAK